MICRQTKSIFLFFIWLSFLPFPCTANAEEPPLLELIKTNEFLCSGNVDFIKFNGQEYLVSVGKSFIKNDTPEAKLNAKKEAELNALEGLTKFIYDVQISSKEELKTETQVTTQNSKVINREINESYLEIIREKGEGILKNLTSIGKWKSSDGKEYFYALGFLIK